jgi:hypothetical protein
MSVLSITCAICHASATCEPPIGDARTITCPRCGTYRLTGTAEAILAAAALLNVGAVSGWIRRQNTMGVIPVITDEGVIKLRALMKPPFQERISRLDQAVPPIQPDLVAASYSDVPAELVIIVGHLQQQGLITEASPGKPHDSRRLTPKGFMAAEDLRRKRAGHTQAFVAMQFSNEMQRVYDDGFQVGIRRAGFQPMLISNKEHANKIDDEIIAEIRRSAFLVYFETGFSIGLGLQVIWTCRNNDIADLHFDIRQYNCIAWKDEADLAQRLQRRIEAMFGQGPLIAGT